MKNTKKVTFEISTEEYEKFNVLEAIALSNDMRMLRLLNEILKRVDKREYRRKRTKAEISQRADWMEMTPDMIAE